MGSQDKYIFTIKKEKHLLNIIKDLILDKIHYIKKEIEIINFDEAEDAFGRGKKMLIDPSLSPEQIKEIVDRLQQGRRLSPSQRQHVLTAQEFYRAHEGVFLERATQTAHKGKELKYLRKILDASVGQKMKILDGGCGMGRLTIPLLAHGFNVWGVDVSRELIVKAQMIYPIYKGRFIQADLTRLPYKNKSFAAVLLMWHVISEVSHALLQLFLEMNRILMRGGILIFDVPDITSDLTKMHYQGMPGKEGYEAFVKKVPAMDVVKTNLALAGFQIVNIRHLIWGIHKYVVLCKKI